MSERLRSSIFITAREHELPYSKGLTASTLMVTGLGPGRAYAVANRVEKALVERGQTVVTDEELRELTLELLREEAGERYVEAYIKWQSVSELDIPMIVLIGGATGVGKSTIAHQLAYRLGITRVVSTDAVREVLRSAFTAEMFPTLYASSFEADEAVRQPIPHSGDRLIIGFREQAAAVAVGAQALIDRAIAEGTDLVLEGAHLVPGFLETVETDEAVVVPLLVAIDDEELHRSHFIWRNRDKRPSDRYLSRFKKIRKLQKYMITSAAMRGVPTIQHNDLDSTLSEIVDHVLMKALEMVGRGASIQPKDEKVLERAVEAVGRAKDVTGETRDTQDKGVQREVVP